MDNMSQEIADRWPVLYKLGSLALAGMVIFLIAVKGRAFFSVSEALLLVSVLISCYKLRRLPALPKKNVLLAFVFFAGGLLLPSLYNGEWKNIAAALDYVYVMLTFFIMYIGARCFARENILYKAITLGAFVSAVMLLMAFSDPNVGWERLAIWDNPNTMVDRLAIPIPFIVVALYELKENRLWRGMNIFSLLVIVAAVGMTRSRGGITGLICGLLTIGVLYWPICKTSWSHKKKMITSMAVVTLLSAMLLATTMFIFPRTGSDNTRKNIMQAAYQMFEEKPLTGVGLENYVAENKRQVNIMRKKASNRKEARKIAKAAKHTHSHNVLLYLLATTGIVGCGGYIIFTILIWYKLVKSLIWNRRIGMVWAMMSVIVMLNVHGLVDLSILHRITSWMFLGMLGLAVAMADIRCESTNSSNVDESVYQ